MSKVKIEGNASGTGTLTIAAPNTNTDRTLTLPDGAGELLTTTGDGSQLNGVGKVLQVVHFDYNTTEYYLSTASSNGYPTGLTANITPTSSTSKILVQCSASIAPQYNLTIAAAYIQRTGPSTDRTTGSTLSNMLGYTTATFTSEPSMMYPNSEIRWLDSPNTTSQCTYTLYINGNVSGQYVQLNMYQNYYNSYGGVSYITLMEIAA
jgi:hypothetical protein